MEVFPHKILKAHTLQINIVINKFKPQQNHYTRHEKAEHDDQTPHIPPIIGFIFIECANPCRIGLTCSISCILGNAVVKSVTLNPQQSV